MSLINKLFGKVIGTKTDKDMKEMRPIVEKVNALSGMISQLSDQELREKTAFFRQKIRDAVKSIEEEVEKLNLEAETEGLSIAEKEQLYKKVDELNKTAYETSEAVLEEIHPEGFAVIKETARRLAENGQLTFTATDHDKKIAASGNYVEIDGDKAIWHSKWMAGGNEQHWEMVHYDVQLIGGTVLHKGKIAEMQTGEGKTLVATLPLYLNALTGKGVHVVTVNDYLAKRDSEWMGPLFEMHGLTIDCIDRHQPNSTERRNAYLADITYGTNNEFGFDYLRDNMARSPEDLVQRKHNYAIVDEVDSVLIDDARTPLIISGPVPKGDQHEFMALKPQVESLYGMQRKLVTAELSEAKRLFENEKDKAGIHLLRAHRGLPKNKALIKFLGTEGVRALLQKTENFHMQDQSKEMHVIDDDLFFVIDEKNNAIELTEKGIELISKSYDDDQFFVLPDIGAEIAKLDKEDAENENILDQKDEMMRDFSVKSERIHTVNQLLRAYTLFEKDTEYVVMDNKVKIVDEQTGRIMEGRRYSDGLHQAIEAKENVKIEAATQTFATVTLQNYFRMYNKLSGMTGTAETEAGELWDIYKLDVVVIPTNRPIQRDDREDLVYKTNREKFNAIVEEVVKLSKAGRPVLVGTTSVEISELLSRFLKMKGVKHSVLNAKLHQSEADVVAEAGRAGNVTIATNMAGRGTDIKLSPEVKAAGGLAIIGTERHDSRRVDRQLRGRSGRQGDPGSSQFFVSLEDNLMRLFGSDRIAKLMDKMGLKEGEVIQHSMITKSIERAQKKVEENNFGVRKRLLEFDDVMNAQREVVYKRRRHALFGDRLSMDITMMLEDLCHIVLDQHKDLKDYEGFRLDLIRMFSADSPFNEDQFENTRHDELGGLLYDAMEKHYRNKVSRIAAQAYPVIKNVYEDENANFENILVPFSDGHKGMQVACNLEEAYNSEGTKLIEALEKNIALGIIDEAWKDHLRAMDNLKQSVHNAVYEQKDPLLIYKFESFKLFKEMLEKINRDILSFLFKADLPVREKEEVKEAKPLPPKEEPRVQTSRTQIPSFTSSSSVRQQPVAKSRSERRKENRN